MLTLCTLTNVLFSLSKISLDFSGVCLQAALGFSDLGHRVPALFEIAGYSPVWGTGARGDPR